MSLLYIIIFVYIIHVVFTIIKAANNKTLYLWSPVIVLDLYFIENVLMSFVFLRDLVSDFYAFQYIIYSGLFIGIFFHFVLYKYNFSKPQFFIPYNYAMVNKKRETVLKVCLVVLLITGFATGVTSTLLRGGNIEGLRRSSEVGIGFIRDIPLMILQISFLVYLFISNISLTRKFIYTLFIAFVLFISTGNKAIILNIVIPFIIYLLVTFRGFKVWHFLLYKFLIPLTAGVLNGIRSADLSSIYTHTMNYLNSSLWLFQVNTYQIIRKTELTGSFLNGDEFVASVTRIIPRFLWPDKPLSYDYYYKELINYDFEGGGTPMPYIYRFYTNFGYYFPIFYFLYFVLLYFIYRYSSKTNMPISVCIIILFFLSSSNSNPLNIAYFFELLILIAVIFRFAVSRNVKF